MGNCYCISSHTFPLIDRGKDISWEYNREVAVGEKGGSQGSKQSGSEEVDGMRREEGVGLVV
jgi:hypothetical protein